MSKLTQALSEIISWLQINHPEAISRFRQGLSINQIEEITKDFPFMLPKEVYELYQFCNGGITLGDYDLVMYSLESALENSYVWESHKETPSYDNHILTIFHGDGHDVYYALCEKEEKKSYPIWCAFSGLKTSIYASSLTNLMLTVAECYQTGAYYTKIYEEGDLGIEIDLNKLEKIFQKYNPEQMNTWRKIWKDSF